MSNYTISPNMNLIIPTPGQDPGPDYATNNSNSLTIIDQHNHSSGSGVQINPNGLDINSDLPINSNNLTLVGTINYISQSVPFPGSSPNLGCTYVAGNELYYNDEAGNVVQITNSGSVNAGAGSISGLPSGTASASYSAGTFTWQSATNTAANMDAGSYVLRNNTVSSKGLTLSPPNAMAANYSLTLPNLPGATSFVTLDSVGNFGTTLTSALADAVGTTMTSTGANAVAASRTRSMGTTVGVGGIAISVSSGVQTVTGGPIVGFSVTITTSGRPVMFGFAADNTSSGTGNQSFISGSGTSWQINNGSTELFRQNMSTGNQIPSSSINGIDFSVSGAPGTYTYAAFVSSGSSPGTIAFSVLYAYEL